MLPQVKGEQRSNKLYRVCLCHSYEPHTFTPRFSDFTVYLWDSRFLRHRNVRVTVWLSVKVLWILNLSCQTFYCPKGNGIIIPPLKMADHRYLPVSGSLCVKINASYMYKYFTQQVWSAFRRIELDLNSCQGILLLWDPYKHFQRRNEIVQGYIITTV